MTRNLNIAQVIEVQALLPRLNTQIEHETKSFPQRYKEEHTMYNWII